MILLLLSLFVSSAQASTATDLQLRLLAGAKSKAELVEARADGGAIQVLKENCSRELRTNSVPESCFKDAKIEFGRKFLSAGEFDEKMRALSSFCRRAARESSDLVHLRSSLHSDAITLSCRNSVQRRADDLNYQIGEVRELDRFLN